MNLKIDKCRCCGEKNVKVKYSKIKFLHSHQISICQTCKIWQLTDYPKNNILSSKKNNSLKEAYEELENKFYLDILLKYLPQKKLNLLEINLTNNFIAKKFPLNFNTTLLAPLSRDKIAIDSWIENLNFAPHTFDLLIMNDSLDRLNQPGDFLRKALTWIKSDGFLLLGDLIDPFSLSAILFRNKYYHWSNGKQIYPPIPALKSFLSSLNLATINIYYPEMHKLHIYLKSLFFRQPLNMPSFELAWPWEKFSLLAQKNKVEILSDKKLPMFKQLESNIICS